MIALFIALIVLTCIFGAYRADVHLRDPRVQGETVPLSVIGGCRDWDVILMDPGQRFVVTYDSFDVPPYHPNADPGDRSHYIYQRGAVCIGAEWCEFLYPEGGDELEAGREHLKRLGTH